MTRRAAILVMLAALTACGRTADLRPAQGEPLPVKPLMARATPSADDLLTPPVYANPERVDELIKRSQPRVADHFDLPPPNGAAAPLPSGAGEDNQTNEMGPASPQ